MTLSQHTEVVEAFRDVLEEQGVHAALAFLNARTPHRFTGIYRLDPPVLRNVRLFDGENPSLEVGDDAPLHATYCSITAGTAKPFATPDAPEDDRLEDHPARESTRSYCGVPIVDEGGTPRGTLCHFDVGPRPLPQDVTLLKAAAPLLLQALRRDGAFPA